MTKLYGSQELFLCQKCSGLTYQSQKENELDSAYRRMNKLLAKADADPGLAASYSEKPKGRWRRTHRRLVAEAKETEQKFEQKVAADTHPLGQLPHIRGLFRRCILARKEGRQKARIKQNSSLCVGPPRRGMRIKQLGEVI